VLVRRVRILIALYLVAGGVTGCAARVGRATPPATHAPESLSPTIEGTDKRLAGALLTLRLAPTAAAHRSVASEYRRLGVLDSALTHYSKAVEIDPKDWVSFDSMARIWRDWGFPERGLPDAYRARQLAPDSPIVANTIGTLLQGMGQVRSARQWYMRALNLDATAAYALNNVCYALIMMQEPDAVPTCRRAVAAAPKSTGTRNNLALALAAAGDLDGAREQFTKFGRTAAAEYNIGILQMAIRDYRGAARQFALAVQANPQFTRAAERAQQARIAAEAQAGTR
jgi:tetratricopeptide (TPR) repeat protein